MLDLHEYFRWKGAQLVIDYEGISKQITHKPTKGVAREEAFRAFLRSFLPASIGVDVGEIVSTSEMVSNQCDVILNEWQTSPVLYNEEKVRIFPIETVFGIVEIKSKLDQKELEDSFEKITRIKGFPKVSYYTSSLEKFRPVKMYGKSWQYFPTLGFVFAYDSIDIYDLTDKLRSLQSKVPCERRIDCIWVLKKGIIRNRVAKDHFSYPIPTPDSQLVGAKLLIYA